MKIIKKGNLFERSFTCERCNTIFSADIQDWEERKISICSVGGRNIPKEVIDAHTEQTIEIGVRCPICKNFIEVNKGESTIAKLEVKNMKIFQKLSHFFKTRNMITDQLVTYEVAELAKEKGFNVPTRTVKVEKIEGTEKEVWDEEECRYITQWETRSVRIPTQSLLKRWLREEKGLHINIDYNHPNKSWTPTIIRMRCIPTRDTPYRLDLPSSSSYEVALEKALIYALNMLTSSGS